MELFFLIAVGVLFLFAFFDLIVGVSNDAVNFLNSAIGSKVTSRRNILIIASLGILAGALFSSGMMEVARKGIFHPEFFTFAEIMFIFLAVMITDVVLLDLYNTLKLPTSTTVSIVFELLGAAVAVSLFKIFSTDASITLLGEYINSAKAIEIISGILLSVLIAFAAGAIIQYIVRLVFTFDFTKKLKYYGAVRGGIAITAITYFLLIKGAKGSQLLSAEQVSRIATHTVTLIGSMLVGRTILLRLGNKIFKINIPKVIVIVGTFALAMAFAGNDLVNFIGVPLAGFNAFTLFQASGGADPFSFLMADLAGKVPTPFLFLFIAGAVMVVTLWFSSKAKSVTETEIGLAREGGGHERFQASGISRFLVRCTIQSQKVLGRFVPHTLSSAISNRLQQTNLQSYTYDAPAFDLIRASVNLTVASVLIAIATSMKLPLSTTYVTFMVAMGSSLADGVRGRDSAVYRVTGVLTVIGGWFLTALSAFVAAAVVATIIYLSGVSVVLILVGIVLAWVYKTHIHHAKSSKVDEKHTALYNTGEHTLSSLLQSHAVNVSQQVNSLLPSCIGHLIEEQRSKLKDDFAQAAELKEYTKVLKGTIHYTFMQLPDEALDLGQHYVKGIVYIRKLSTAIYDLVETCHTYVSNQHPELVQEQREELNSLIIEIAQYAENIHKFIQDNQFGLMEQLEMHAQQIFDQAEEIKKMQLNRIKMNTVGVRNSMLYLNLLVELQNLLLYYTKLLKSYKKIYN